MAGVISETIAVRPLPALADLLPFLSADAARAAGRVAFTLLLLAVAIAIFIGWRRR
jgi:hypothetical protein